VCSPCLARNSGDASDMDGCVCWSVRAAPNRMPKLVRRSRQLFSNSCVLQVAAIFTQERGMRWREIGCGVCLLISRTRRLVFAGGSGGWRTGDGWRRSMQVTQAQRRRGTEDVDAAETSSFFVCSRWIMMCRFRLRTQPASGCS
jgi:hypothetical protein